MWLPGPLYESLPYAYIIGGVLFISGTMYIGLNSAGAPLYIACGLISIVSGAAVFARRTNHRRRQTQAGQAKIAAQNPSQAQSENVAEHSHMPDAV